MILSKSDDEKPYIIIIWGKSHWEDFFKDEFPFNKDKVITIYDEEHRSITIGTVLDKHKDGIKIKKLFLEE